MGEPPQSDIEWTKDRMIAPSMVNPIHCGLAVNRLSQKKTESWFCHVDCNVIA